jgi:adenine deaminase
MILAFVGLAGVPDYGLTELGLIDTPTQSFVPVLVCCRCPQHAHAGQVQPGRPAPEVP